jgi:hypothetical protein
MLIHQAFFGNKNGSHNLLYATIDVSSLIGKLKSMTDKPASIDIEYAYLSAYKVELYYVFCKTMNDTKASRGGMVFSHCLIIKLSDIENLNNLVMLFDLFANDLTIDFDTIQPIELDTTINPSIVKPNIYDTLIHYLIQNKKTIIYLGYFDFEQSIIYLWHYLPTALRENFSFTISGSPNEIKDENYTIVHTPLAFERKWSGYAVMHNAEIIDNQTPIHLFLSENNTTNAMIFNQFITDNEIYFDSFAMLVIVNSCYKRIKELEIQSDFKKLRVLISEVNKMSPDINKGNSLKARILSKFIDSFKTANCNDISTIRNLELTTFPNGQNNIKNITKQWATKNIQPNSPQSITDIVNLLKITFTDIKNWCNAIIIDEVKNICVTLSYTNAEFIWKIWAEDKQFVDTLNNFIPTNAEQYFVNTFPSGKLKELYNDISKFAVDKKWFSLYALSNLNLYNIEGSIKLQTESDTIRLYENLLLIANKTNTNNFVLASVSINNNTLHEVSGKLCSENTSILSNLDIQNIHWQTVLHEFYRITKDFKKGIKNLKSTFYDLLYLELKGSKTKQELLIAMTSAIDNIFDFEKRKTVWSSSLSIKKELLNKTSLYVFKNWKNIDWESLELELLENSKSSDFINNYIITSSFEISYKMQFLEKLGVLNDYITVHIFETNISVNTLEVAYIANKIKTNKWERVVRHLYYNSSIGNNFNAVLTQCKSMLSFWQILFLSSGKRIKPDDLKRMIDKDDLPNVFAILDKIQHKGETYSRLRDEYIQGFSKGKDRRDLCDRLKVYIGTI